MKLYQKFFHKYIIFVAALFFLLVIGSYYKDSSLSQPFIDEQYNFAIGKYLSKGEILYDDIITNHQPITHIFSALVQIVRDPNTTFSLLVNHRVAMAFWSGSWALLLIANFGTGAFLYVILYELTKSYMFGNLFLAEAMVVYPLSFLVGIVIYRKKLNKVSLIMLGVSIALVLFILGPVWPVLAFLVILIILRLKSYSKKDLLYPALGGLIIFFLVLKFTSVPGYLHNYLYINYAYTVPEYHKLYYQEPWMVTILKSFFTPVFAFTTSNTNPILWVIRLLSVSLVLSLVYLVKTRKTIQAFIVIVLLGLCNIRFIYPGSGSYEGFHLLPWYSVFLFVVITNALQQFRQNRNLLFRIFTVMIMVTALFVSARYAVDMFLNKKNLQEEYTINYSTHTDIGQIISIMKDPKDTLFTTPDNWLVYWQSNASHISKLFGYYPWMVSVPELHENFLETFTRTPPTFFYCENCSGLDLGQFLKSYKQVIKNGEKTNLYVLPYRIDNLTKKQREQLKFYGINKPQN